MAGTVDLVVASLVELDRSQWLTASIGIEAFYEFAEFFEAVCIVLMAAEAPSQQQII